jgi:putative FmdB family regulatory protein
MPLYEYRCDRCEHDFEILQRLNADNTGLECPECGSESLAKQFSSFAANTGSASTASTAPAGGCCQGTLT